VQFSTRTRIEAAPDHVWGILTDLPAWTTWNTTVTSTEGTVALGNKVTVGVTANPGRAFAVTVAELAPPHRMVWRGGMPLGLFAGTRTYTLSSDGPSTVFDMTEVYTGPMAGMVTRSIPDLQPSFDEFAQCLKSHAEKSA